MKKLTLAALLIAGCASTNVAASAREAKARELAEKSREITDRARQCVAAVINRGRGEMHEPTGLDSSTKSKMQIVTADREQEISKCKAAEAREKEELISQERSDYVLEAEQERDRASLMMILTTSRPH
jgi:hypothetical protein